jgi:hypothetical protein
MQPVSQIFKIICSHHKKSSILEICCSDNCFQVGQLQVYFIKKVLKRSRCFSFERMDNKNNTLLSKKQKQKTISKTISSSLRHNYDIINKTTGNETVTIACEYKQQNFLLV